MPIGPFSPFPAAPKHNAAPFMSDKFASRKFMLAVSSTVLSTVLLSRNRISSDNWVELNKWVCCSYFAANALSGITIKPAIWNK